MQEGFVQDAYRRGVLSRADDGSAGTAPLFRAAGFYTLLDVFVMTERDAWLTFDAGIRRALDAWYFDTYYSRLDIQPGAGPTDDAVLTLDEALERVDSDVRQLYLAPCDCRSLSMVDNDCQKPLLTCLSWRDGLNTSAHRGVSTPVGKTEAKDVIRAADAAGLMHTANANTICNCCADCCYLSRARTRRNAELAAQAGVSTWPLQSNRIVFDAALCVNCGLCASRCPIGLFTQTDAGVNVHSARCLGCGLCVNTCPVGALKLEER
jgi:Pyruvate/2-oxoacid:ferredoxin oxidoreductase delta subunit